MIGILCSNSSSGGLPRGGKMHVFIQHPGEPFWKRSQLNVTVCHANARVFAI